MKKTIAILLALFWLSGCACENCWRDSLEGGLREAREEGKPVLLLVTNEECSACESNWHRIFGQEEFLPAITGKCVPVCLYCPFDGCIGECARARSFKDGAKSPSLFLLDSQGNHLLTFPFPYGNLEKCQGDILKAIEENAR